MEDWQKKHIESNMSRLLEITDPNHLGLLADLKTGSFSTLDIQNVKSKPTNQARVEELFEIAMQKPGAYDELAVLFDKHKLTGPLQIFLDGYKKNKKDPPSSLKIKQDLPNTGGNQEKKKLEEWIVGNQEGQLKPNKIVGAMDRSGSNALFLQNWRTVAAYLDIKDETVTKLKKKLGNESIELAEIPLELLAHWVGEKTMNAKLVVFCQALDDSGLNSIAERIKTEFCL